MSEHEIDDPWTQETLERRARDMARASRDRLIAHTAVAAFLAFSVGALTGSGPAAAVFLAGYSVPLLVDRRNWRW